MPELLERRAASRIDKIFRVLIATDELGEQWYVARNISETGMFVEMADPLPLRTRVIVRFCLSEDDAAICAMARVQNHYYLQFTDQNGLRSLSGIGLRILRFLPEAGMAVPDDRLH